MVLACDRGLLSVSKAGGCVLGAGLLLHYPSVCLLSGRPE